MITVFVALAILAYFAAPNGMDRYPIAGYIMTLPIRIFWVVICMGTWPGLHGALMGTGLALLMSFERKWLSALGGAFILLSVLLWPSA